MFIPESEKLSIRTFYFWMIISDVNKSLHLYVSIQRKGIISILEVKRNYLRQYFPKHSIQMNYVLLNLISIRDFG